ncbi:hypothetical protein BH24ACT15_BH24ACT15_38770 [soil metagenome]
MNYVDRIAAEIQRTADPAAMPSDQLLSPYRYYAVLLLAKGEDVTAEDVHNAWAAWTSEHNPAHHHLKPFHELPASVQRQDEPFAAAIRQVAARMARDE